MEKIIDILEEIKSDVDFKNIDNLVDGHYLDSLAILSLIAELEDEFDITIPTVEIVPSNFNSVEKIWQLILKIKDED